MASTRITLSVKELALPSPRQGSIESHSGLSSAAEDGQEIHQRLQAQRQEDNPEYEAEVLLSHTFLDPSWEILVSGRADGILSGPTPEIEEIKSTFHLERLQEKLHLHHPYLLQLRTYGYFYWKKNGVIPRLKLTLVSTRNNQTTEIEVPFDEEDYEQWLSRRLKEIREHAKLIEKRAQKRRNTAESLTFPFAPPRPGQLELIKTVENELNGNKRVLIQAPTGLGKTVGVLYPALREALHRGSQVHYVTPKNSQHSVAEDAFDRISDCSPSSRGKKLTRLTLTSKGKICFQPEPLCDPQHCEYARDHFSKVSEAGILEKLQQKKKLTRKTFESLGREHEVCPYQLQLEVLGHADLIVGDYHYALSSQSPLQAGGDSDQRLRIEGIHSKPNLIIDEFHNFPNRGMDLYSPALSTDHFKTFQDRGPKKKLSKKHLKLRREFEEILEESRSVLRAIYADSSADQPAPHRVIQLEAQRFLEHDQKLKPFLSRYLESDVEIEAKDPVLSHCFAWSDFTETLQTIQGPDSPFKEHFLFTGKKTHLGGVTLQITCIDPSPFIRPKYSDYENTVAFSATVKPVPFYSSLSGLGGEGFSSHEFPSPFDPQKRKILIIPQVSTRYSQRDTSAPKIAEIVQKIAPLRPGNYFVFFPSFAYLEKVAALFKAPEGFEVIQQYREMPLHEVEAILDRLRSDSTSHLLFAVQGGVFSEGIDTPGDMIIGAFIVGPPLPHFDLEREEMRKLYEAREKGSGFNSTYAFPAMAKAIQAAGRVIRTASDKGLIVLIDDRFLNSSYSQCMPKDWFRESPHELVSRAILKDIQEFWEAP